MLPHRSARADSGRRRFASTAGFATEGEARRALDRVLVETNDGTCVDRNDITVAEYLREWIERAAVDLHPTTTVGYHRSVDFLSEELGKVSVVPSDRSSTMDALRHYLCAAREDESSRLVFGNGDRVAAISAALAVGDPLRKAVERFAPEPDPPLNTPRIAAVIDGEKVDRVAVRLDDRGWTARNVEPAEIAPTEVLVLHTYSGTVDAPPGSAPSFRLRISRLGLEPPEMVWSALSPERRVLLCDGSAHSAVPTTMLDTTRLQ